MPICLINVTNAAKRTNLTKFWNKAYRRNATTRRRCESHAHPSNNGTQKKINRTKCHKLNLFVAEGKRNSNWKLGWERDVYTT